jgi:hypothetical protein
MFWACLVVAVLPSARNSGVYDSDLGPGTIIAAFQATALDLSNFCARNAKACDTGLAALKEASTTAKTSLLAAYDGVRDQYEEPDRETMTGSVKKAGEGE